MHACEPLDGAMVGRKTIHAAAARTTSTTIKHTMKEKRVLKTDDFMHDYLNHND